MPSAHLPARLLRVAAQFASTDDAKETLTGIFVKPAAGAGIQIYSTDGTRAFRATCHHATWNCGEPVLLSAKAFKKLDKHAKIVVFDGNADGCARILGGKGAAVELMTAIPALWRRPEYIGNPAEKYPDIDRIWPVMFGDACDQPISFDALLLAEFLKQVSVYSWNGKVTMFRNSPKDPMVFTSTINDKLNSLENVEMQLLLAPVGRQRP